MSRQKVKERDKFSQGLIQWFESRKYKMGVPTHDFDFEKEAKAVKDGLKIVEKFIPPIMPYVITGKISSQQVFDAIVPFFQHSDLIGFCIDASSNRVAVVLYADELETAEIEQRLDKIFTLAKPLAELGMRMNGQSMAAGYIHVLAVYFDSKKYQESVSKLIKHGVKRDVMGRTYMYTGFVSIADKTVVWSQEPGALGAVRKSMAGLLGTTKKVLQIFDEKDLQNVLTLSLMKSS